MGEISGLIMVTCSGLLWPLSVYKSVKSRTAGGKSLFFKVSIWTGYVSAIIDKIVAQNLTYIFYFYILSIVMVSIGIRLYFHNHRLNALASRKV